MITQTIINPNARADFDKHEFEKLIVEKGRLCSIEEAIQCPCKTNISNAQSNCKNCGGAGWLFINRRELRTLISGIDASTKYAPWSEQALGILNITASVDASIAYMDRIGLLDSEGIHQQVLTLRDGGADYITFLSYDIKSILYASIFVSVNESLLLLDLTKVTFQRNKLFIDKSYVDAILDTYPEMAFDDLTITFRYKHIPYYHILDIKRESMQSYRATAPGVEIEQLMPQSFYAKRAHIIFGSPFSGTLVNDTIS